MAHSHDPEVTFRGALSEPWSKSGRRKSREKDTKKKQKGRMDPFDPESMEDPEQYPRPPEWAAQAMHLPTLSLFQEAEMTASSCRFDLI